MSDSLFVITGGPGSGKTSLIEALANRGIATMPEAGRAIIQHQTRIEGSALPWSDRALFAELMLTWELRSHDEARKMSGPVLMDRGIPDIRLFEDLRLICPGAFRKGRANLSLQSESFHRAFLA